MGTYLATGIVHKILIQKKEMTQAKLKINHITESLQKELDLKNYDFSENDEELIWEIKPQMLVGQELAEFLKTQFMMYVDKLEDDMQVLIQRIRNATSAQEIIEMAKNKGFRMMTYFFQYLDVNNGFPQSIPIHYHLMTYFFDGKIIMECYNNILHYFERNIRLQEAKFPVAACVKVLISS